MKDEELIRLFEKGYGQLPLPCFACDAEGIIVGYNHAVKTFYGYNQKEALGKSIFEFTHSDDDVYKLKTYVTEVFEGRSFNNVAIATRDKNDVFKNTSASFYPLLDDDGKPSLALIIHYPLDKKQPEPGNREHEGSALDTISELVSLLSETRNIDTTFNKMLTILGEAVDISRAYVFANQETYEGQPLGNQRWEWVNTDINPPIKKTPLKEFDFRNEDLQRWADLLSERKPVFGSLGDFPESERHALSLRGVKSLVIVPIFLADTWWGFIEFEDCLKTREWGFSEINLLITAAELAGTTLERLTIESQLRYWSEFNRNIIESANVGLFVLDKNARIQAWNVGMETQFRVPAAEVLGEDIFKAFPELKKEEFGDKILRSLEEGKGFYDNHIIHQTLMKGNRILEVTASPMLDTDGNISGLVVINNDVTDYRLAAQKLADSEEMYRALSESALIGVYIYYEDRFLYVNQQMARMTGYTAEELLQISTDDIIAPEDRKRVKEIVLRHKNIEDASPNYSFKIIRKDGGEVYLEVYTRAIVYQGKLARVGHCIDISDRVRAQGRLRFSEELYHSTIESMSDMVHVIDRDMRLVMYNHVMESWASRYGIELDDVIDKSLFDVLPFLSSKVREDYDTILKRGEPLLTQENIELPGQQLVTEVRKIPVKDKKGNVERIVTVLRDVTEVKEAEEALKKSESRYRLLAENATDMILTLDMDLHFTYISPSVTRILGYDTEEIVGLELKKVLTQDSLKQALKVFKEEMVREETKEKDLLRSRTLELETNCKDGSRIWVEAKVTFIRDQSRKAVGILGTARDVTERKQTEQALKESEEKYHVIADRAPFGVLIHREGKIIFANPTAKEILKYPRDKEVTGLEVMNFIAPSSRDKAMEIMQKRKQGHAPSRYEIDALCSDGEIKTVEAAGEIFQYQGDAAYMITFADITERKRAEQALKESEERYRRVNESVQDIIFSLDSQGKVIFISDACKVIFGLPAEDFIGKNMLEAAAQASISKEHLRGVIEAYSEKVKKREEKMKYEFTFDKDGKPRFLEIHERIIYDSKGNAINSFGVARDITERKRAEEELKRRSKELSILLEISTEVSASLEEEEVTHLIAQRATDLIGADGCTIYRFNTLTEELVPRTTTMTQDREKRLSYRIPLGKGITGRAAVERRAILANNVHLGDEAIRIPDAKESPRCLLVAPLISHGELWGVMTLIRLSSKGFTEHDLELFSLFANQVADAAVNSSLFSRLGESEEKYRSFVEQAIDGIVIVQDRKLIFANRTAVRMTGYTSEEILGMDFSELLVPEVRDVLNERYRRRIAGEKVPSIYETKILTRDGQVIDAELNAGIIHYKGQPADLVFVRDIRERNLTANALRQSEERYRTLQANVPVGVFQTTPEGRLIYVNPVAVKILGYDSEEELLNVPVIDLYAASEQRHELLSRLDVEGAITDSEVELRRKDGFIFWASISAKTDTNEKGEITHYDGIIKDITERKRAEKALKESEERYRTLQTNVPVGVFRSTPSGELLSVNPALVKMLGFDSEEQLMTVSHSSTPLEDMLQLSDSFYRGGSISEVELELKRKDGSTFWGAINARKVTTESGEIHYDGIIVDITERKRVEEALREGERFLASIFASIQDGISILDKNFNIIRVNSTMEHWYSHAMPLTGKKCYNVYHGRSEPCEACPTLQTLKRGRSAYEVVSKIGPQGEVVGWLDLYTFPLIDLTSGKTQGVIEYARDITDRKKAEEALRESEERYRSLFEDSPISLWEEDLSEVKIYLDNLRDNGVTDFRVYFDKHPKEVTNWSFLEKVVDVNKASLELYGAKTKKELIGNLDKILCEESYSALKEELIAIAEGKTVFQIESTNQTLEAEKKHINLRLTVAPGYEKTYSKVLISILDITERKLAEEALRESEEFSRAVIESSPLGISVRSTTGKLLVVNEAWKKIWAVPEEEIRQDQARERNALRFDASDIYLGKWLPRVKRIYEEGGYLHIPEIKIAKPREGGASWVSQFFYAIKDIQGNVDRVVILTEDITDRKNAEQALRESERTLSTLMGNLPGMAYRCYNDRDWTMEFVSEGCLELTGYQPADLIGNNKIAYGKLIHEDDQEMVWNVIQEALSERTPYQLTYRILTSRSEEKWVWEKGSGVFSSDGELLALEGFITDITNRKKAEEALEREHNAFRIIAESAVNALDTQDLCQRVLTGLVANLNFDFGTIRLYDEGEKLLRMKGVVGLNKNQMKELTDTQSLDDTSNVATFVARTKEAILASDVDREAKLTPFKSTLESLSIRSIIAWPILGASHDLLGVLNLWSQTPVEISAMDRAFFERVIGMFATVLERKRAEAALLEREEHYRTLVNTAQEGISLVDSQERFIFVNPKMADLMGYSPEELLNQNLLDFIPKDEASFIKAETSRRIQGGTSRYEATIVRRDGTPLRVLVTAAPIFDANGAFYATLGILTDITELKKAEDELRLRLIYQMAFAQIMNIAIRITDLDHFVSDCVEILGNALGVSRAYLATNYEPPSVEGKETRKRKPINLSARITLEWNAQGVEPAVGKDYSYQKIPYIHEKLVNDEVIAVEVSGLPSREAEEFQETGAISVLLAPLHLRNGFYGFIGADECGRERHWNEGEIEAFRTAVRLIGTVIDRYFEEQERQVAEAARAESDQRYRTLVETSSDIIFLLSPSGQPLYISPATERLGYKPQELLNQTNLIMKAIPPDEFITLRAIFTKSIRDEHPVHDVDCEIRDIEGNIHWFAASWNCIRDDRGGILAVQGIGHDITERKQTERALRLRMEYEQVLFEISSLFLSEGISEPSLKEFLERLGMVTGVSQVYIFSHEETYEGIDFMKLNQRWVARDSSQLERDNLDKIYYNQGFERWRETLSTGESINELVKDMPASERKVFTSKGILAILVLPIFVEGKFWGAIGFEEAKRAREWNVEDIRLLWTASQILSSALATESKAKELARSYDELQERERQITALNIRLVQAEEDERRRIARVLHDEIAQQLTGLSILLSTPDLSHKDETSKRLDEAKDMVKETQKFIRDLSYELRPPALDNLGLAAAVRALARSTAAGTGVSFAIEGNEEFPRADPDTEIMLYRIIQEAVNNALKHAEPDEITITFNYEEPLLRIRIRDDGKGFDTEKVLSESSGLGLRSMRERMMLIGGTIKWHSTSRKGTEITLEVEIHPNPGKI